MYSKNFIICVWGACVCAYVCMHVCICAMVCVWRSGENLVGVSSLFLPLEPKDLTQSTGLGSKHLYH